MSCQIACLVLAVASVPQAVAGALAADDGGQSFARPRQLVDIGGRRLHLHCDGSGPVTVVFDAPGTEAGWSWHKVQPEVAKRTRACVYDRAGLGFSDPSPLPVSSGNAVADLRALLRAAGIAPPYILVGSSYGGANVQLYAYRHPDEVQGLVLVDAQHDDETERLDRASQGKLKQLYAMQAGMMEQCAQAARTGFDAGSAAFGACTGGTGGIHDRALAAARLAVLRSPVYWQAALAENAGYDASGAELKRARRSFGDLPLVVLTRGVSPYAVPGRPPSALNKATEAEHLAMQKELAALSSRSTHRVVAGAGHIIQEDRPEAVVEAVDRILEQR